MRKSIALALMVLMFAMAGCAGIQTASPDRAQTDGSGSGSPPPAKSNPYPPYKHPSL